MSIDLTDPETFEIFDRWTKGDKDAARLLMQFCELARKVDDLVDESGDKQDRISTILELSLVHVAGNPFFQRFHSMMSSAVFEMITYWRLGDSFKKSDDEKKQMFGFVYRESTDRLAVIIASIIGGSDHAKNVAEELYAMTHGQSDETLVDWLQEDK